jgi:prevent-host-death family protein
MLRRTDKETADMAKVPELVPVTDLREAAADVLKQLRGSDEPIIITQRGRAAAVMLSVETYQKTQHERELLRVLAKGETELRAGKGFELEEVLAQADALLKTD